MIEVILVILCIIGGFLNTHSTYIGLRKGDTETNPLFNYIFNKVGILYGSIIGFILSLVFIYFISNNITYMVIFIVLKYSASYGNYTGKQPLLIRLTACEFFNLIYKNKK